MILHIPLILIKLSKITRKTKYIINNSIFNGKYNISFKRKNLIRIKILTEDFWMYKPMKLK